MAGILRLVNNGGGSQTQLTASGSTDRNIALPDADGILAIQATASGGGAGGYLARNADATTDERTASGLTTFSEGIVVNEAIVGSGGSTASGAWNTNTGRVEVYAPTIIAGLQWNPHVVYPTSEIISTFRVNSIHSASTPSGPCHGFRVDTSLGDTIPLRGTSFKQIGVGNLLGIPTGLTSGDFPAGFSFQGMGFGQNIGRDLPAGIQKGGILVNCNQDGEDPEAVRNYGLHVGGTAPNYLTGGVNFAGTQTANVDDHTLDDYEEGDWTPIIVGGVTSPTYLTNNGHYTKIGRVLFFNLELRANGGTPNGDPFTIGNLPFPSAPLIQNFGSVNINYNNVFTGFGELRAGHVSTGSSNILFYNGTGTINGNSAGVNWTNGRRFIAAGFIMTA